MGVSGNFTMTEAHMLAFMIAVTALLAYSIIMFIVGFVFPLIIIASSRLLVYLANRGKNERDSDKA